MSQLDGQSISKDEVKVLHNPFNLEIFFKYLLLFFLMTLIIKSLGYFPVLRQFPSVLNRAGYNLLMS